MRAGKSKEVQQRRVIIDTLLLLQKPPYATMWGITTSQTISFALTAQLKPRPPASGTY